jgi:hypothetical protein
MRAKHMLALSLALVVVAMLLLTGSTPVVRAQRDSGYTVDWWTVDGGGQAEPDGPGYALSGAMGQPDAAGWSGNGYTLSGGFLGGGEIQYTIYLPVVLRNH